MNSIPAVNQDAAFRREREADDALLRQALEALRELRMDTEHRHHNCGDEKWCPVIHAEAAIAAIRARLGETT